MNLKIESASYCFEMEEMIDHPLHYQLWDKYTSSGVLRHRKNLPAIIYFETDGFIVRQFFYEDDQFIKMIFMNETFDSADVYPP